MKKAFYPLRLRGGRGRRTTIIYYDLLIGSFKAMRLQGTCIRIRHRGLNTKVQIQGYIKPTGFQKMFFVHSPQFLDITFNK